MPVDDVAWALAAYRDVDRRLNYGLARSYYDGEQRIALATAKLRSAFGGLFVTFADNLCPAVVDSVADRLEITGFESVDASTGETLFTMGEQDELAKQAWALWRRNQLPANSNEVHHD